MRQVQGYSRTPCGVSKLHTFEHTKRRSEACALKVSCATSREGVTAMSQGRSSWESVSCPHTLPSPPTKPHLLRSCRPFLIAARSRHALLQLLAVLARPAGPLRPPPRRPSQQLDGHQCGCGGVCGVGWGRVGGWVRARCPPLAAAWRRPAWRQGRVGDEAGERGRRGGTTTDATGIPKGASIARHERAPPTQSTQPIPIFPPFPILTQHSVPAAHWEVAPLEAAQPPGIQPSKQPASQLLRAPGYLGSQAPAAASSGWWVGQDAREQGGNRHGLKASTQQLTSQLHSAQAEADTPIDASALHSPTTHLRERPAHRLAAMARRRGAPATRSALSRRGSKAATRMPRNSASVMLPDSALMMGSGLGAAAAAARGRRLLGASAAAACGSECAGGGLESAQAHRKLWLVPPNAGRRPGCRLGSRRRHPASSGSSGRSCSMCKVCRFSEKLMDGAEAPTVSATAGARGADAP